ncbi:NADH-quinone oxidoreductase subunit M [Nocardioides limicola]|uniref:NADH-quinone oxidoreductase subunit M n=1 Tax=Nocardioides limicola TaxID=2803368 RepID=UPI00193B92B5|nr:NADH-quinone oxidoreductase subunit M [Nocardioides sp. DJM-14]
MSVLTVLILIPLLGAALTVLVPRVAGDPRAIAKMVALGTSLVTLAAALAMAAQYNVGSGMQFTEQRDWIPSLGIHYAVGVDGLGLVMVLLTAFLVPVVIAASWHDADDRNTAAYFALMLALQGLAIGVFSATDVFLFYVLFEATLIPAYFLIGGYGIASRPERARAAVKFLIFMLAGGLVMLAAVIGLYVLTARAGEPTYLIAELSALGISGEAGRWLFVGFFFAFAVKAPLFPVHTWLPDTTAAATPGTSVLLVCVLDKIGTYGMLRFCLELFPEASLWATPLVVVLALISIVYGAFLAIGQENMLRLIGLTSLSHFGFIVLGIFVFNLQGGTGAVLYMVNHGLATAALFLVAGYLIRRRGSALIRDFGGVEKVAPVMAGMLLIGALATAGLPGLSTFISEFLVLVAAFAYAWWAGAIAVTGIVLAAIYVLWMYQRMMTGPVRPATEGFADLSRRELSAVVPLVVALVVFGFFPKPLTDVINPAVEDTLVHVEDSTDPMSLGGAE